MNAYSDIRNNAEHNASARAFINSRMVLRFRGSPLAIGCEARIIRIAEMIERGEAANVPAMLETEAKLNRAGFTHINREA